MTPIIYTLMALAAFFVAFQLITDTTGFLGSMITMVGVAVLIYGAIYFLFLRNRGVSGGSGNEMKKYKQAVKQSKQKYKQPTPTIKKSPLSKVASKPSANPKRNRKRMNAPHLRVIEGNKNKDKNRASF
ncbi:SA1362 family protein [Halobacillus salinus]|nr:SA1362 family protein [Halobacillus salinus]